MKFKLTELLQATRGHALHTKKTEFTAVTTDGRAENQGKIFFALKGERFDAHQFLDQAVTSGASALVVEAGRKDVEIPSNITVVEVSDTLQALQGFALWWRTQTKVRVVAITGSNGKTSTKNFTATLMKAKYKVHATAGNLNNHIGVPLTLLEMDRTHQVAVIEMGMNHSGEIKKLCEIAAPDVVLVTNVGSAHLEFFGTVEKIAQAKEEIYQGCRPDGTCVFNLDNPYTKAMHTRASSSCRVLTFSNLEPQADVCLRDSVSRLDYMEIAGRIAGEPGQVKVPIFGRQNIYNLMAASALALACQVEPDRIWKKLGECRSTWGRNQIIKLDSGATALFDAYNANPDSAAALLENFSRLSVTGQRVGVFGDMLELGPESPRLHEELGRQVGTLPFDVIWFLGAQASSFEQGIKATKFSKKLLISKGYEENLATQIRSVLKTGDVVLVKGSRGMKLERVIEAFHPIDFSSHS